MKAIILTFVFCFLFSSRAQDLTLLNKTIANKVASAVGIQDYTNSELAALWFDGNVTDNSTNGNNGTAYGSPTYTTGATGKSSHAILLNGTSQYVTIGTAGSFANFTNQPFSITLWFKQNALGTYFPVTCGNGIGGNGYEVEFNNGSLQFWNGKTSISVSAIGVIPTTNIWYFAAFTYSGSSSNLTIFLNGTGVQTNALANFTPSTGQPLTIGGYLPGGFSYGFPGVIDDFRVWQTNLSAANITTLYNNGAFGP